MLVNQSSCGVAKLAITVTISCRLPLPSWTLAPEAHFLAHPYVALHLRSGEVREDRFKSFLDGFCGLCIVVLYFLYLNVVKGALSVFDCSKNKDDVWILDADPSIKCYVVRLYP